MSECPRLIDLPFGRGQLIIDLKRAEMKRVSPLQQLALYEVLYTLESVLECPRVEKRWDYVRRVFVRMPEANRPPFWARTTQHWSQTGRD